MKGQIISKLNNMETKELKIIPPEGFKIDKENSTFEKIVFKAIKKIEFYEDIAKKLFYNKKMYHIADLGEIDYVSSSCEKDIISPDNAPTRSQLEWLLALNKLQNVANYLNDGWRPIWNTSVPKYFIDCYYDGNHAKLSIASSNNYMYSVVYFKSAELAKQAIEILGEEEVKTALGVYKDC